MNEPVRAREPEAPVPPSDQHGADGVDDAGDVTMAEIVRRAREHAEAEAAVDAVMRREHERESVRAAAEHRRHHTPPIRLGLLGLLLACNAYIWFGHPNWLRYNEPAAPSIDYYASSWKIAVYLQRQRIEEYRREQGHIPRTAQQAGPPVHGVTYTPIEMRDYKLAAGAGARKIVYDSQDSLSTLMGRTLVQMGLVTGGVR